MEDFLGMYEKKLHSRGSLCDGCSIVVGCYLLIFGLADLGVVWAGWIGGIRSTNYNGNC